MREILIAVLTLGVGAWAGGFITVFVVSLSSRTAVGAAERVSLFRDLGRRYAVVASVSMALIVIPAAILTALDPGDAVAVATFIVALAIIAASIPAVRQARRMGRLRREALAAPEDTEKASAVSRGSRSAAALRSILAAGSLALVGLAIALVSSV